MNYSLIFNILNVFRCRIYCSCFIKHTRRFTLERQKHHSKHSAFNLDDTEEFLTHKGQNIDEIEEFGDVYHSDSDDGAFPYNV